MLIKIKRGLDLKLGGAPEQTIHPGPAVSRVALLGADYPLLKPSLAVAVGDRVSSAQTLFAHRTYPAIRYKAPAAGRVVAIHRGAKRRLLSVVIERDGDRPARFAGFAPGRHAALTASTVRDGLLQSGLWTAFRMRCFGATPQPECSPRNILVTAIDTNPLAADPEIVIAERKDYFARGLDVISRLASGNTFVCMRERSQLAVPVLDKVIGVDFRGPHPAGLPGTHAHYLAPAVAPEELWQIGYQDVIAIGELFLTGRLSHERVISLAGPGVASPRLIRTRAGASLEQLLAGELGTHGQIISGSVLSGRRVSEATSYLGRFDTQVSVLDAPPASSRTGAGTVSPQPSSGMVCVEAFERVWPFRMPPLPLLRAILAGDTETAEAFGCLGLHEEDLALCTYVCPAGQDFGAALRATLRELAKVA